MIKKRHHAYAVLIALCFALTSCGDPLDDRYGVTDNGSINGVSIFKQVLTKHGDVRSAHVLSPRLYDAENNILIHVSKTGSVPDVEACEWIEDWLKEAYNRQAIIVLRNGDLTTWLCKTWAAQARAEARKEPELAEKLNKVADQLEKRADAEGINSNIMIGDSCQFFTFERLKEGQLISIRGLGLTDLPKAMRVTGTIKKNEDKKSKKSSTKEDAEELVERSDDDEPKQKKSFAPLIEIQTESSLTPNGSGKNVFVPWAVSIPVGEYSRMIVVADALPLLDGALPDKAARTLMQALIANVMDYSLDDPKMMWVNYLRVRDADAQPNPMLAVLTTPPVSWITWHLVALLVVLAFLGAGWMGRKEVRRDDRHDRFSRHVLALAARLRDTGQATWCVRAIARVVLNYRKQTPHFSDEDSARHWLQNTTKTHLTSSTVTTNETKRSHD